MNYTYLGRTGLQVSTLCLGTMNFGPEATEAESFAIMDKALDMGINFFDTANIYGQKLGEGFTEKIIGRWLAQGDGRRDKIVLATKVYNRMGTRPNESKLSAYHIRKACEDSLRRLQTDHIDLYQMHHIDRNTPWEEVWQAMEQLMREGKVTYIGSSNFAAWNIAEASMVAKNRNIVGLVSEQSIYHLNNRMIELEVVSACKNFGLGILPWSPLGSGLLAGVLKKEAKEGRRKSKAVQARIERHRSQLEAWEGFCDELGEEPANVALAWLLHNEVVTAPIIGPRTLQQLEASEHCLEIQLNDEHMKKLDEIWPGPGVSPEAYAW